MLSIPPRTTTLAPGTIAGPAIGIGRPWWALLRPWPAGMRFEDVDSRMLDLEHAVDNVPLGPPPAPSACYGSSALMGTESRFAEPEIGVPA